MISAFGKTWFIGIGVAVAATLLGASSLAAAAGFNWTSGTSAANSKLLPAEQAFRMQTPRWDGKKIHLQWHIAPGYYLYRDRIKVRPAKANIQADAQTGELTLPPAKAIEEAGIGEVHIYRNSLQASYAPDTHNPVPQKLEITVQGCADQGVCYPPLTRVVTLSGPPPA